eukprot:TRINITY_DN137_c0_g1_i7.p1 TRINITY_DN137_c0_g1~~TRINITY_DN137_c0_g1_i7.p1  ORF type:complete len:528 (+),score=143.33 TRINITY_DN137_c0_g1_i7:66-1649(+)
MHLSHTVGVIITAITCFILSTWGSKPYESRSAHIVRELDSLARTLDLTQSELMEHRPTTRKVIRESDLFPSQTGDTLKLENSASVIKKKGPWFLGTCTGTKNSGAWMREWIELQIAVGVDHVWVADDNPANSTDITTNVLKHYEKLGYVTIIPPPGLTHPGCEQISGPDGRHNCAPVKHCFEYASPHVKWLLFADTDEFIFPHNGCSVAEHIKNHCNPDATHIYVKWERFGSSGFETHPNGLMLENFLSSGGTCHNVGNGVCARRPFDNCPECRHSKVIYNTECAKVEHAGWIHWPVNTTDWKAGAVEYSTDAKWVQSEGTEAGWKHEKCSYVGLNESSEKCNDWAWNGGGSKRPKEYTPDCCTAGIGYNHYGTQSRQYYERINRGSGQKVMNMNNVLSFSVVRFLRALRTRFIGMGAQVSDNAAFVDAEDEMSCFVEANWAYEATEDTTMKEMGTNMTLEECCKTCHSAPMCRAFTAVKGEKCSLLIGSQTASKEAPGMTDSPHHLHASRTWELRKHSGIPMRGQC